MNTCRNLGKNLRMVNAPLVVRVVGKKRTQAKHPKDKTAFIK